VILLAVAVIAGSLGFAQNVDASSHRSQKPVATDRGLVMTLAEDLSEPPDSPDLKACMAGHPPLACVMLTITIRNEGVDTILTWTASCGNGGLGFELQESDGSWEPFPLSYADLPICSRNVLEVQKLAPGESRVLRIRLADSSLSLDTAFDPPDGRMHPHHPGRAFLVAPGRHTIRAVRNLAGCVASSRLKAGDALNSFDAQSLCVTGVLQQFLSLQSNELNVSLGQ
jgi:hypothetical protein